MSDANPEKTPPCCEKHAPACACEGASTAGAADTDCCAPVAGPSGRVKAILFLIIMGAAVAVGAHAILKKSGGQASARGAEGDVFNLLADVDDTHEAAFVILAGKDEAAGEAAFGQARAAAEQVRAGDLKNVIAVTLGEGVDGHAKLAGKYTVKSFPCALVARRGCLTTAVNGEITVETLMSAFRAVSNCDAGSSCCPE